ncbi:hypothetical protein ACFQ21_00660 [Ohtaekwangia kribbensis]|uniref:Uncharacterized protein n=1 Tax=Ohtaekwangia kribbensis TaxID=688913 RepID=A0ABW3JVG1_9BACT
MKKICWRAMLQHQAANYVISVYLSGMFIAQASEYALKAIYF